MLTLAALLAALAPAHAAAGLSNIPGEHRHGVRAIGASEKPSGCLYEGRWFTEGAHVSTGEACLQCACFHGTLSCRRRACLPLPVSAPPRCHVLHPRESCCPELHCPDGVTLMEHSAKARSESDDTFDIAAPTSLANACVEGGTVYAAGSAMRSHVACEQCFCLGGAQRCVRPRCLPPPPGCRARPAPGACCPQRYYCDHASAAPPKDRRPHDCKVDGKWISEGERVISIESSTNCTQCFCLRGEVRCQPLVCAPPLLGCKPLLQPGQCCAHQYHCEHDTQALPGQLASQILALSNNYLVPPRNDHRSFHSKPRNHETVTKNTLANTPTMSATKNHLITTTKVKRKTSEPSPSLEKSSSKAPTNVTIVTTVVTQKSTSVTKLIHSTDPTTTTTTTTEMTTDSTKTEQPEGSIRIVINGTINCTAELSSTSLPLNVTHKVADKIKLEALPRIPLIDVSSLEDHTFSPNEIITDRNVNGRFEENESFVINVTSSLRANNSDSSARPPMVSISKKPIPVDLAAALNASKKKTNAKGDYDFDYTKPTLPPSLPNLKIIPFVAADAVVKKEPQKETYPILEREDKFPVYYPSVNTKNQNPIYATRREDVYHPTQYPVFQTEKEEKYPPATLNAEIDSGYSDIHENLELSLNEYKVSTSIGGRIPETNKVVTQRPTLSTTFKLETPVVNLFSPPIETEGGFIPKSPGIIDEYYSIYPSTPSGISGSHLTTSMQLDIKKSSSSTAIGECLSGDGHRIFEGESITLACSECTCAWGELHCGPKPCPMPAGCSRRPASSASDDLCCGTLVCEKENNTTPAPFIKEIQHTITIKQEKNNANIFNNSLPQKVMVPLTTTEKDIHQQSTTKTATIIKKVTDIAHNKTKLFKPTTQKITTTVAVTTTTVPTPAPIATNQTETHSLEYEEEEDEDELSFGNVLKLLLSENYESKTTTLKTPSISKVHVPKKPPPRLSTPKITLSTIAPFIPLPSHPYTVPKVVPQDTVNRIDHLVLGEATAIKKTTLRPSTTTYKPVTTTSRLTTQIVNSPPQVSREEPKTSTHEGSRPPALFQGIGGLLKLAGCNIYGRMYRVGRIITELSTPCQECWCTELGVQCKALKC